MTVATSTASPASTPQASAPPDGLPVYRLLTGPDDASFCRRVSDALPVAEEVADDVPNIDLVLDPPAKPGP